MRVLRGRVKEYNRIFGGGKQVMGLYETAIGTIVVLNLREQYRTGGFSSFAIDFFLRQYKREFYVESRYLGSDNEFGVPSGFYLGFNVGFVRT